MSTPVLMPQMGESIAEGTVVRWIKKVGDQVDRDEPLFEISTDKVDAEIPSPAAGVLSEIRVKRRRDRRRQQRRRDHRRQRDARSRLQPSASAQPANLINPINPPTYTCSNRFNLVNRPNQEKTAGKPVRRRWCAGSPRNTTSTSGRLPGRASVAG